jgi:glycosyltransferase involved in cell wall biosynthesis
MKRKLKILELTNFSAGICGVWSRVKQEAIELSKRGYEVRVFSSNAIKGEDKIAPNNDNIGKVRIIRFPFKKLGGESFMRWFGKEAEKKVIEYSPDIIIAHNYRHLHTTKALEMRNKLRKQGKKSGVFLVTHAPFAREENRGLLGNLIVKFYDFFIGKKIINRFDKIISITHWELPYLHNLHVNKDKIVYIPNSIDKEFFQLKPLAKEENKILFLGRISPIKNLEVLIKAFSLIKNKSIKLEIVGPSEQDYKIQLEDLIKKSNQKEKITFLKPVYNIKQKIAKIDSCKIFVLPSKSEGQPQSLIEAMARNKIVIASNIPASGDIIKQGVNGFLFDKDNPKELAEKIDVIFSKKPQLKNVKKSVESFNPNNLLLKLEKLF